MLSSFILWRLLKASGHSKGAHFGARTGLPPPPGPPSFPRGHVVRQHGLHLIMRQHPQSKRNSTCARAATDSQGATDARAQLRLGSQTPQGIIPAPLGHANPLQLLPPHPTPPSDPVPSSPARPASAPHVARQLAQATNTLLSLWSAVCRAPASDPRKTKLPRQQSTARCCCFPQVHCPLASWTRQKRVPREARIPASPPWRGIPSYPPRAPPWAGGRLQASWQRGAGMGTGIRVLCSKGYWEGQLLPLTPKGPRDPTSNAWAWGWALARDGSIGHGWTRRWLMGSGSPHNGWIGSGET